MTGTGITGLLLIIANTIFSYKGLKNRLFFEGYRFEVDRILLDRDYKRLITAGFLHVNWSHLLFNMLSLFFFSGQAESYFGVAGFLVIYFSGLLGGNLLSLLIHRNHGDYTSVGASGAVCGIIFASIAVFPGMSIGLFMLPISIPGWIYGILYVLYSIYGIRSGKNNIGHEGHLGGALIGLLTALIMEPSAFMRNYFTILVIAIPALTFVYLILTRPHFLLIDNYFYKKRKNYYSIEHRYNEEKNLRQLEIDKILEKIHKKGINSLSKKEREFLDEYSKK